MLFLVVSHNILLLWRDCKASGSLRSRTAPRHKTDFLSLRWVYLVHADLRCQLSRNCGCLVFSNTGTDTGHVLSSLFRQSRCHGGRNMSEWSSVIVTLTSDIQCKMQKIVFTTVTFNVILILLYNALHPQPLILRWNVRNQVFLCNLWF